MFFNPFFNVNLNDLEENYISQNVPKPSQESKITTVKEKYLLLASGIGFTLKEVEHSYTRLMTQLYIDRWHNA